MVYCLPKFGNYFVISESFVRSNYKLILKVFEPILMPQGTGALLKEKLLTLTGSPISDK